MWLSLRSIYLFIFITSAVLMPMITCHSLSSLAKAKRATRITDKDCFASNGSCVDCVQTFHCFFCNSNRVCWKYRGTSITNFLPPQWQCNNNNWQIGQCSINGLTLIILVPIASSILIIVLTCGLYCCCCRNSYRKMWFYENERHESELARRQHNAELRNFDRKARRERLAQKYRSTPGKI
ncbi:uncharacterized protein TRIADDRAFT_59389 [Trichoplax adhaerens]|uniref:PSI domain-containing protein n=1 Tax=Trichoplax adhaerens TaxID=10228 RepID=B3S4Y2_TRIAD|nr:hypothetical protein TRIADDRAFT_59389 [Trichoplax adhaerens]EDV22288.1 hypothetical protein TRIADDRAFT_59389 [Trichoplax adhaerens]|eukprot:XP_002115443.1 hypothetical protein TRIADDRAFT_59389 [Trichoplax adhaerens]